MDFQIFHHVVVEADLVEVAGGIAGAEVVEEASAVEVGLEDAEHLVVVEEVRCLNERKIVFFFRHVKYKTC